ncbi:MAG: hypothetical protein JSS50_05100 [Proteobacteria bacterium]|nr:hypothetical protein [Pseudomonadota bacterium]
MKVVLVTPSGGISPEQDNLISTLLMGKLGGGAQSSVIGVEAGNWKAKNYPDAALTVIVCPFPDSNYQRSFPEELKAVATAPELKGKVAVIGLLAGESLEAPFADMAKDEGGIDVVKNGSRLAFTPVMLTDNIAASAQNEVTKKSMDRIAVLLNKSQVQVQKIGTFRMANFWDQLVEKAKNDTTALPDPTLTPKNNQDLLRDRLQAACGIMMPDSAGFKDPQRQAVASALENRLSKHTDSNSAKPADPKELADYYATKALLSRDRAMYRESGIRALTVVGTLFTGVAASGAPVAIGVAAKDQAAEKAIEAFNSSLTDGGKALMDQFQAHNPYLIAMTIAVCLGIGAVITALAVGPEVVETASGKRSATRHLENMVEEALTQSKSKQGNITI